MSHSIPNLHVVGSILVALGLAAGSPALGQSYQVTDLGTLGGNYSQAWGLNDSGDAVGLARSAGQTYWNAVLWPAEGGVTDLGLMGGSSNYASGINSAGQVVGMVFRDTSPQFGAWIWQGGSATTLWNGGGANDINNLGEVCGFENGPVLWLPTPRYGRPAGLNYIVTGGWSGGSAVGLNNLGQVAGQSSLSGAVRPFLWLPSAAYGLPAGMNNLGTLGDGPLHAALDVNALGQVVGWSDLATSVRRPFLWLPAPAYGLPAGMHNLGTLGGSALGFNDWANTINDSGQVVGQAQTAAGAVHAFLWQNRVMTDLNDLIPADSGWVLIEANDINADGAIVGRGIINGQEHGFLLTLLVTLLGDLNCDGAVNTSDIGPFVLALVDPVGYAAAYPGCDINLADINQDALIDGADLQPFVNLLLAP